MKTDIVLCGVGGQGVLSVAAIVAAAALRQGLHVKQGEVHGMSQRGGAVQDLLLRLKQAGQVPVRQPPLAVGRAPPGAAAGAGHIAKHQVERTAGLVGDHHPGLGPAGALGQVSHAPGKGIMRGDRRACDRGHGQSLAAATSAIIQRRHARLQRQRRDHRLARCILQFDKPVAIGRAGRQAAFALGHAQRAGHGGMRFGKDAVERQRVQRLLWRGLQSVDPQEHRRSVAQRLAIGVESVAQAVTQRIFQELWHIRLRRGTCARQRLVRAQRCRSVASAGKDFRRIAATQP